MIRWILFFFLLSPFSVEANDYASTPPLPPLGIDPHSVTLSGISSGAFFAVQFAVAHSSKIAGVASVAGGVYNCSEGDPLKASRTCMKDPQAIELERVRKFIEGQSQAGLIDDPEFIRQQKVFILHGTKDAIVHIGASEKLIEFYSSYGAQVQSKLDVPAGHGFPSEQVTAPCDANQKPWLVNCSYDAAGEILKSLYGNLSLSRPMKRQNLTTFDQSEFDSLEASMESEAYIYIPELCRQPQSHCRLHVAFHGCQQNPDKIGDQFVALAGYNEWAETNGLVILYPAASTAKLNPNGCWDWFGYTGRDYALRQAKQIVLVHRMIERLKQMPEPARKP